MKIEQITALLIQLQAYLVGASGRIISAIIIFIVGRWLTKVGRRLLRQTMVKASVEPTLVSFASNVIYYGGSALIVLLVLGQLGIQTTSLIAVLGTAGLAIGLALQGSLANFAAGMLIVLFRPLCVGDWVEIGNISGFVEEIQLFTTVIRTLDNRTVTLPNTKITDNELINFSRKGILRVDLEIGIAYSADIDQAKQIVQSVLADDQNVLETPIPMVGVIALADSSVNLAVRPWAKVEHYWDVYFATLENVKKRFDREGIPIPFPQRDVHLYSDSAILQNLATNGEGNHP